MNSHPFFGHAIGGSLGASKEQMHDIVAATAPLLNDQRPIHLLGIGRLTDIITGVKNGIHTFDCVHPTRLARHGGALVKGEQQQSSREHISLRRKKYQFDQDPIASTCSCLNCRSFSQGYIHHLFRSQELLGLHALTIHNISFMNHFLGKALV